MTGKQTIAMRFHKTCSIADCGKPVRTRGWCTSHYTRWLRHGDPLGGGTCRGDALKFLEAAKNYTGNDCLMWPFAGVSDGKHYPTIGIVGRKMEGVHRLVCRAVHGMAPTSGHEVAHSCGKGRDGCISPTHLRWATHAENIADQIAHGTTQRGERQGAHKLKEQDILKIRALAGTISQRELGLMFGVGQGHISRIVLRKEWAWLE